MTVYVPQITAWIDDVADKLFELFYFCEGQGRVSGTRNGGEKYGGLRKGWGGKGEAVEMELKASMMQGL